MSARGTPAPNRYKPTPADRRTVINMKFAGFNEERIAQCIGTDGVTVPTLYKYFKRELTMEREKIIARIGRRLSEIALGEDKKAAVPAAIFILKCQGRWRENPVFDDAVKEVIKRVVGVSEKDI